MSILTIIAAPDRNFPELDLYLTDPIRIVDGQSQWLEPDRVLDISFPQHPLPQVVAAMRLLGDLPFDWAVSDPQSRRKKLLIADMDSTIITVECLDELADFAGKKAEIAAITEAAMRGELDFPSALKERIRRIAGLDQSALQACYDQRVKLMSGAHTLLKTMRQNGAFTALVSGGFTFFTSRVREAAGFDVDEANVLEFVDGKLTGVAEPILDAHAKLKALKKFAAQKGLGLDQCCAVGDGANDRFMIEAAGLGVAYHSKPILRQHAHAAIVHNDLTSLLYAQGYRREDWVM